MWRSSGRLTLPSFPQQTGYSQSMSIPSKTPAPAPGPPALSGQPPVGRSPLMNMSMHDFANFSRDACVRATSEKNFESVQPPIEIRIFKSGWAALSFRS